MYLSEILTVCADLENQVARMYRAFSTRFADNKDVARLWRELALEEETHAEVLGRERRGLDEQDDAGPFLPDYDQRVDTLRERVRQIADRAARCALPEAFEIASELERCGLEEIYEDLVVQADPAFKLLSERLESVLSNLPAHQERLTRAAAQHRRRA